MIVDNICMCSECIKRITLVFNVNRFLFLNSVLLYVNCAAIALFCIVHQYILTFQELLHSKKLKGTATRKMLS
jgi:hypothetical protein